MRNTRPRDSITQNTTQNRREHPLQNMGVRFTRMLGWTPGCRLCCFRPGRRSIWLLCWFGVISTEACCRGSGGKSSSGSVRCLAEGPGLKLCVSLFFRPGRLYYRKLWRRWQTAPTSLSPLMWLALQLEGRQLWIHRLLPYCFQFHLQNLVILCVKLSENQVFIKMKLSTFYHTTKRAVHLSSRISFIRTLPFFFFFLLIFW